MNVQVVTDSASSLTPEMAQAAGVTIVDLHTSEDGPEQTTAGLGALELTAAYARLLERGGDSGVVAIHISKELSATWSNANTAAGIFDGLVEVLDTDSVAMCNGFAAMKAAEVAQAGGSLEEVARAAKDLIAESSMYLYLHRLDSMRKGGRLSPGQTLLSTALAIKPILRLADGKIALAAKTRTQRKAMEKLVEIVLDVVATEARRAAAANEEPRQVRVAVQQVDAEDVAENLIASMEKRVAELHVSPQGSEPGGEASDADAALGHFAGLKSVVTRIPGDKSANPLGASDKPVKEKSLGRRAAGNKLAGSKLAGSKISGEKLAGEKSVDAKTTDAPVTDETSEDIAGAATVALPEVEFMILAASDVLAAHSGPGAIAVSTVLW